MKEIKRENKGQFCSLFQDKTAFQDDLVYLPCVIVMPSRTGTGFLGVGPFEDEPKRLIQDRLGRLAGYQISSRLEYAVDFCHS